MDKIGVGRTETTAAATTRLGDETAYRPSDHVPTRRQIVAAWLICGAPAVSSLGGPALWRDARPVLHYALAYNTIGASIAGLAGSRRT